MTSTNTTDGELYYDPFDFDIDVRAHDVWRRRNCNNDGRK